MRMYCLAPYEFIASGASVVGEATMLTRSVTELSCLEIDGRVQEEGHA